MTESRGIIRQPSPSVPQRPISVTKGNIEACASNAEILEDQAIAEMNASTQRVYAAARAAFPERNDPMVIFSEALIGAGPAMARASRLLNKASAERLRCILAGGATSSGLAPERTLLSNTMIDAGSNDINGRNYTLDGDARPQHQSRPGRKAVLRAVAVVLLISVGIGGEHWRAGGRSDSSLSQRVAGLNHAERAWAEAVIDASQAGQSDNTHSTEVLVSLREADRSLAVRYSQLGTSEFRRAFLAVAELAAQNAGDPRFASRYPGCMMAGPPGPSLEGKATVRTCLVEVPSNRVEADTALRDYYGQAAPYPRR